MVVPIGTKADGSPNYLESFTLLQLFGFMILFAGVIYYNELLVFPFFGFDKYTKEAIAKREEV